MAGLTREEAQAKAAADLASRASADLPMRLADEALESASYWVFFHNTVEYFETGNPLTGLAGNMPTVVPKDGGPIGYLGTATDPEEQLADLEAARGSDPTSR